jgi:hypothetical protein
MRVMYLEALDCMPAELLVQFFSRIMEHSMEHSTLFSDLMFLIVGLYFYCLISYTEPFQMTSQHEHIPITVSCGENISENFFPFLGYSFKNEMKVLGENIAKKCACAFWASGRAT